MATESSTYTYESGVQETVTLTRGPATPHGHAVLKTSYSDGQVVDCYVNTEWLRARAEQLVQQRPKGAEDIEALIREAEEVGQGADDEALADYLAARLTDPTRKEA